MGGRGTAATLATGGGARRRFVPENAAEKEEHERQLIKDLHGVVDKMTEEEKLRFVRFYDKYFVDIANLRDEEELECTKEAAFELIRFLRVLENPRYNTKKSEETDLEVAVGQFLGSGPWFYEHEEEESDFDTFTAKDFLQAEKDLEEQLIPDNEYFMEVFFAAGYVMQNTSKFLSLVPSNIDENKSDEEHQKEQELLIAEREEAARSFHWEYVRKLKNFPLLVEDLPDVENDSKNDEKCVKKQKLDHESN